MCVCSEAGGGAAEGGVEADGTVSIFFSSKKRKGISEERGKKKGRRDYWSRAADRREWVIMVTKTTACCPVREGRGSGGGQWVRRIQPKQLCWY